MRLSPIHRVSACAIAMAATVAAAPAAREAARPAPSSDSVSFVDVTGPAGIRFTHVTGARGDKQLPETMGSGLAWIDYDGDGHSDLYLVQEGVLPSDRATDTEVPGNALLRNLGDGTFRAAATGAEDIGYGMAVAAADYDGDGWVDLFVSNFGPDALYRNNGDGTFSRVRAGVENPAWSASAAWGDLDADGLPDLYVTHYLDYDADKPLYCGEQDKGIRSYCHVDLFEGVADSLYLNRGDGTFEDVAAAVGVANAVEGKGLGVTMADLDRDGDTDIYVANDTTQNFLYTREADGTYFDQGLFSGAGYSQDGKAQAGMGVLVRDLDGDGEDEIAVTNFSFETNNLYRLLAPGAYLDEGWPLGLAEAGLATLGFGLVALDADADGDAEVAIANGHILDNVAQVQDNTTYAQPNHLFMNTLTAQRRAAIVAGALSPGAPASGASGWRPRDGLLRESHRSAGPGFELIEVTRGLAVGDADGDGLPDLALSNSAGPARLLANRTPDAGHRLVLRLRGRGSNRDALGARVTVVPEGGDATDGATGFEQAFEVRSSSSYGSQDSGDLLVGLATSPSATVRVRWPDGEEAIHASIPAGHAVLLVQGHDPVLRPLR